MNTPSSEKSGWTWQAILSTYRYWGLVLASALLGCSFASAFGFAGAGLVQRGLPLPVVANVTSISQLGLLLGGLLSLFFAAHRTKLSLLAFATVTLVGLLSFSASSGADVSAPALSLGLMRVGQGGFALTAVLAIATGRPSVPSSAVAYGTLFLWIALSLQLGAGLGGIAVSSSGAEWRLAIPVVLAIAALLPIDANLFNASPEARTVAASVVNRSPVALYFLCSFVPFYVFYWIYRIPGELRSQHDEIVLPTRNGALCMALFAPFLLPVWFHDLRSQVKGTSVGEKSIRQRSPALLAAITFFLPAIGAAMLQSDINACQRELSTDDVPATR